MVGAPALDESELDQLVSYPVGDDEAVSRAVVAAFRSLGVDPSEKETRLANWVDTDVLEDVRWDSAWPVYLSGRVWGRRVVVTADEIRIYESMDVERRT